MKSAANRRRPEGKRQVRYNNKRHGKMMLRNRSECRAAKREAGREKHAGCERWRGKKGKEKEETRDRRGAVESPRKGENWEGTERLGRICPWVDSSTGWGKPSPKRPTQAHLQDRVSPPFAPARQRAPKAQRCSMILHASIANPANPCDKTGMTEQITELQAPCKHWSCNATKSPPPPVTMTVALATAKRAKHRFPEPSRTTRFLRPSVYPEEAGPPPTQ